MKVTLTQHGRTVAVETPHDDLTIMDVVEDLLQPLLLAAGFHPQNVEEALGLADAPLDKPADVL